MGRIGDYKALLFDMDGTLVDSMPYYAAGMRQLLEERGISCDEEMLHTVTPLGYKGAAEFVQKKLGVELSTEAMMQGMAARTYEGYALHIPAKPHVPEVLRTLAGRGVRLHVLTASPHAMMDVCFKRLGIFDLFGHIWSCEDFSTTKSDPAIYTAVARELELPIEDILFLDDNLKATLAAKRSGIGVCGVYDTSSAGDEAAMREACHHYIYDFSELL